MTEERLKGGVDEQVGLRDVARLETGIRGALVHIGEALDGFALRPAIRDALLEARRLLREALGRES